jgi:molybdopterin-guanine dinucleotide biosynthesis protein A
MTDRAPLYLLAGGRSSRMGSDKARVEVAGRPLLLHVLEQCGYRPDEATVVAAPGRSYTDLGLRTIEDGQTHEGPFSGLVTALGQAAAGPLLVVGCDQWGLTPEMLRCLEAGVAQGAPAAAFRGQRWHPLPLAVRSSSASSARAAFDAGECSLWRWLERSGALALPEPEGWSEVVSVDDEAALALVLQRTGG